MFFYKDKFLNKNTISIKHKIAIIPNNVQPGIFLFISEVEYHNNYFCKKRIDSFKIGD